jgi:predicted amidophosphoribosyltransferase
MKCQKCKYDLTGNASRFCPECGLELTQLQSWLVSGGSHSLHYSAADNNNDGHENAEQGTS